MYPSAAEVTVDLLFFYDKDLAKESISHRTCQPIIGLSLSTCILFMECLMVVARRK